MNVPSIDKRNVAETSVTFHLRNIPRFSCIITEWRNAVFVSQGRNGEFSTGSHAQYPDQPSSTYAHHIPMRMPSVRKNQENSAQRLTATIHSVSRRRVNNAAVANANGIA